VRLNEEGELACPSCGYVHKNAHQGAVMVEVPILPEEEVEAYIVERRDLLQSALNNGHKPLGEPSWLCHYCSAIEVCEEGIAYAARGG
jgi:hypothetical protein